MENQVKERIRKLRREKKLTQQELAKALDVSPSTISMYEQGRREPDIDLLLRLAVFFQTTTDDLLGLNDQQDSKMPLIKGQLNENEWKVIHAYRSDPDLQKALNSLLGIESKEHVALYMAAHSKDQHHDSVLTKTKADWEQIKNAPQTNDTLL